MSYPPPPSHKVITRTGIGGWGIGTHIILSICTGGCWLPVWFLHWLFTRSKKTTVHYQ